MRDPHVAGLDGPAADAVVATLGAMTGEGESGAPPVAWSRCEPWSASAAPQTKGQAKMRQARIVVTNVRTGRRLTARVLIPSLNGRWNPAPVKRGMGPLRDVPKTTTRLIFIGRHDRGS